MTVRDHREEAEENVPEFRKPRPLPRPQRWTLDVAASGTVESWHDPAKRLVDLLRTISTAIQEHYGESLSWRASRGEPSVWSSSEELARLLSEIHKPQTGARGLVQGYLESADTSLADVMWRAGSEDRVVDCTVRFNPRGGARPLARYGHDWLVRLLGGAVVAARAQVGRIVTSSWLDEDARRMVGDGPTAQLVPFWLGELTFVPTDAPAASLPDTLVAHPWPTPMGAGTVVALADLTTTVTAPSEAVDAMLAVRPHVRAV